MLAKAVPNNWDLIALQELYLDSIGLTRVNSFWNVIYPSNKNLEIQNRVRSVILVNTKIYSEQIQQITIPSNDITAIKISTAARTLILINIYNPTKASTSYQPNGSQTRTCG